MEDVPGLRGGENHPTAAAVDHVRPDHNSRVTAVFRIKILCVEKCI
jgi:hypothetical protein